MLRPQTANSTISSPVALSDKRGSTPIESRPPPGRLSVQDDAKLVFGVVFSLRNMVRKLSGPSVSVAAAAQDCPLTLEGTSDDNFISYRTAAYKLHYYETPTNLKFVMLTDIRMDNLRVALHQIYVNLYVEFGKTAYWHHAYIKLTSVTVTKNPLSRMFCPGMLCQSLLTSWSPRAQRRRRSQL
jgi:hypothetical protein